jgi:hypothetical protein
MKVIELERVTQPPEGLESVRRAMYYVTLLLDRGPGVLYAEPARDEDAVVFRYRSFVAERGIISYRAATEPVEIDLLARGAFRPMLARMGFLFTAEENPYGGSGRFQVKFRDEATPRDAFLFIYLANEPSIGTWVRLHWYGPQVATSPSNEGEADR